MKNANILIVEDDKATSELIKLLLAGRGHKVCGIVSSGEDAVSVTLKSKPDLVLMDIKINGKINGIIAFELIRQLANVPVIFISAFADTTTIDRAMKSNPDGYIVKPFKSEDLLQKVESVLGWQRILCEE